MKKFLLLSISACIGASMFAQSSEPQELYQCYFNKNVNQSCVGSYTASWKVKIADEVWNIANFNNNNNGLKNGEPSTGSSEWDWVRGGRKGNASVASVINDQSFDEKITSVSFNALATKAADASKINSIKLNVCNIADNDTTIVETIPFNMEGFGTTEATYTVSITNPAENAYYQIVFDFASAANNGFFQLNSITYFGIPSSKSTPDISFAEEEYSFTIGKPFYSPTVYTNSDGAVTYSSSDESIATVDATTGDLTLVANGSCVITAKVAATDNYKSGEATYDLQVIDPSMVYSSAMGDDFTFEDVEGTQPWSHTSNYGLKATGYSNNVNNETVGIAASPVIDLTNYSTATLNFQNVFNQFKVDGTLIDEMDLLVSFCELVILPEGETEWTSLPYSISFPASQSWTFVDNAPVSLSEYAGKKIQFGYKYTSTEATAGTWEIKNINIKGEIGSSINEIEDIETAPRYYNLQGVETVSPQSGLYIEVRGNKSKKVLF